MTNTAPPYSESLAALAPAGPRLLDCGHYSAPSGCAAGYATTPDTGRTICYRCAAEIERAEIRDAEPGAKAFGYYAGPATMRDPRYGDSTSPFSACVTTWSGERLLTVRRAWTTREGFGRGAQRIECVDSQGRIWQGRGPIDSGTYVRLRLTNKTTY